MAGEVLPINNHERPARVTRSILAMLAIAGSVAALAKSTHISRYDRLASTFHLADFDSQAQNDFDFLTHMKPYEYDTSTGRYHQELGQDIQDAASRIFLAGLREGLDNKDVTIDMKDVVAQLVPEDTQQALAEDGYIFTEKSPVSCNAEAPNGDHGYNPIDYSNRLPEEFRVETTIDHGHINTVVPLGSEETTFPETPYFMEDQHVPPLFPWGVFPSFDVKLPCVVAYQHRLYKPNGSTYPPNFPLQIMLY